MVILGYRIGSRPFCTNKDALVESLRLLISSITHEGNVEYWFSYTSDPLELEKMVKSIGIKTYRKYNNINSANSRNNYSNNRSWYIPPTSKL